ncbi:MAG: asparagine synthase (glutamine-hydrolyzing) [Dechloromonas sp.]|nr:asparagine synthase (glutamine-hydrolyzing) [Dechloromonas sp.]
MCGIAGFFGRRPVAATTVEAMRAAIARRGPDAFHVAGSRETAAPLAWQNDFNGLQQALLHARLSIRDPRPAADQPMRSEDGEIWLCYNGEVYGWEQDKADLQAAGHVFNTTSDTEFILRAYQQWGWDGLLPRLRGMFALVVVDRRIGKVFAARDRMGLKPLLYYHNAVTGEFAFASLVRGVLPYLPADKRQFSPAGIDAYLAHRTIPAPGTIFTHLQRLENSHSLEFDLASGELKKRRYWSPEPLVDGENTWQAELDQAIALRTAADRPVGLFLSSGIDSTVLASRLAEQGYRNIKTFTAAFENPAMDESVRAAAIAARLGMANERVAMPADTVADFAQIVADLDEPFADPSSFPTWYLARAAVESVKVVLCGDGGDEMFAGYKRYRQHLRSAWRRHLPAIGALRPAASVHPSKRQRLALEASLSWLDAYPLRFSGIGLSERVALQPTFTAHAHYWRIPEQLAGQSPIEQLLAIDSENYLPEYILRKADLLTMAHGLEGRAPLLDQVFVRRVRAMPAAERFTDPAKQALAGVCPQADEFTFFARKKMGFNPPVAGLLQSLQGRFAGLPERLEKLTAGQLSAAALHQALTQWRSDKSCAEQLLQLLILDESLGQLKRLAEAAHG